ncbi:MAG: heme-binding protein [Isosphaeraceae bacterium]|nr:heme-binding protein [Isosphaeraceae bacterium]
MNTSCVRVGFCLLIIGGSATGQPAVSTASEVRDTAKMFGDEGVRKATARVVEIERRFRVPVTIETVDSLGGVPIDEAIVVFAKRLGPQAKGVYVLMSKQDRRIDVIATKDYPEFDARPKRVAIRDAFLEKFRSGDYDGGLMAGIAEIEKLLASARPAPPTSIPAPVVAPIMTGGGSPAASTDPSGLVLRNQTRLTLSGARKVLAGVELKALEMGYKMNIAVVDDGGHLLAFARMDGARPASANTALTKAITAATFRAATGPLPPGGPPDVLLNLSVQNAAAASGGKITTLLGGVPIIVDGQVIGAVGVGGGSGEQDAEVAKAGIAGFLEMLEPARAPK